MKAFDGYHPTVLLVYFCSVLLVAMFVTNPVMQFSALLGGILFCGMLLGRRALPGNIAFYLSMFVLVAITNPLFSHNGVTPLFFLNGNPVTLEAFVYGAAIGVTVIGVMLWCRSLGEIMTSDKLLRLFGRVLPKFSLILSMALRFIPLFRRQLRRVSRAQRAMGLYSSRGYVDRLRGALRVFTAMVAWSLENSVETAASMRARGYGTAKRSSFRLTKFEKSDLILTAILVLTAAIAFICAILGAVSASYSPSIQIAPVSGGRNIAGLAAYNAMLWVPVLCDIREEIQWRISISKI